MKKALLFVVSIFIVVIVALSLKGKNTDKLASKVIQPEPTPTVLQTKEEQSLFVPYWSLSDKNEDYGNYDSILYFGITPTKNGINTEDPGYEKLADFVNQSGKNQEKLLVLRMLNSTTNFAILKDSVAQKQIIDETITIAKENGFQGIVLDLELSALPFESLTQQINSFANLFYRSVKQQQMKFAITVYGDTFYRIRPFDVKTLARSADQILVMAYDLHKAGGNPGPNFPLSGKEKYGYDYQELINPLLARVPPEKTSVIFGMFGYDWQVDEKNISQGTAKPLSYQQIKQRILDKCSGLHCAITRDQLSGETMVQYVDEDDKRHTVWFEDMESVRKKQGFLRSKGITRFSFWAYSYF